MGKSNPTKAEVEAFQPQSENGKSDERTGAQNYQQRANC
jgi:hypothetical protein